MDQDPWRFLEVLLWGLAGILVNKIIISGWYLRSPKFYREGIVMHIAHIVTTPLLVLVTVLLLSLVTLKVTLSGGNEVALDLSDPRIMVAFSFLIGTSPLASLEIYRRYGQAYNWAARLRALI